MKPWLTRMLATFRLRHSLPTGVLALVALALAPSSLAHGQVDNLRDLDPLAPGNLTTSLKMLMILTVLSIAPAILLLMTAFPRIVIVLGFVRRALSTQEVPPNQVIIGLALILTFFVMGDTIRGITRDAVNPYLARQIGDAEALERAVYHLREFMFRQVDADSLDTMISIARPELDADGKQEMSLADVETMTLIPAFLLSELKRAFEMGFMLYLPFLVIDLVVASSLISMGMLVLPPVLISLPFKILIFVLVDGWAIIVSQLSRSF
ncbi:MAG: flagellar type III secretion system pore protein FliP [Planctomycetota bacterium]